MTALFHYLAPKILPIFPEPEGETHYLLDIAQAFRLRARKPYSGAGRLKFSHFQGGTCIAEHQEAFSVRENAPSLPVRWETVTGPDLGYLEIALEVEEPVFGKIVPDPGYAILASRTHGPLTLNFDYKFANPRVIQQLRNHGEFCLVHTAVHRDTAAGRDNGMLLINPYQKTLLARFFNRQGARKSVRMAAHSAAVVPLEDLVADGETETVMMSGTNRLVAYDVKHPVGTPNAPTSIDHLDPFSGFPTHEAFNAKRFVRRALHEMGRRAGILPY